MLCFAMSRNTHTDPRLSAFISGKISGFQFGFFGQLISGDFGNRPPVTPFLRFSKVFVDTAKVWRAER